MAARGRSRSAHDALIHVGVDGWLFLQGGTNVVAELYARTGGRLPDTKLAGWVELIEQRSRRCRALGIACAHVVVPDKLTVYGDRQGRAIVDPELAPAIRLAEMVKPRSAAADFVDLVGPMRAARDDRDLYWRTDTHWTPEGCLIAYRAICAHFGLEPVADLLERPHESCAAAMDLGRRCDPVRWEQWRKFEFGRSARRIWSNRITGYLEDPAYLGEFHVGARARFENPSARDGRFAILFGDSYSGPGTDLLTGMLAETVRSLEFAWSSGVDWRYVATRKPDLLIFELAERFLAARPSDRKGLWRTTLRQTSRVQWRRLNRWRASLFRPA